VPEADHRQSSGRSGRAVPRRAPAATHPRRDPDLDSRPQPPDLVRFIRPRTNRTSRTVFSPRPDRDSARPRR
jgi:hypothetical protein